MPRTVAATVLTVVILVATAPAPAAGAATGSDPRILSHSTTEVSQLDDELRYLIARAIYGNPAFWRYATTASPPVQIVVEHGNVTLTGVVQDNLERLLAQSLASKFGARSLRSELRTEAETKATARTAGRH